MNKNLTIAEKVLEYIGGKDNVIEVFHCATRLRFRLKDESLVNETELKQIDGIFGTMNAGGMYQVIVGQNVEKVYEHICQLGGFKAETGIDEVLDEELVDNKKPYKKVINNIITYFVSSMTPIINILIGASLWNTVGLLLGPSLLNVISTESELYVTCNIIFRSLFFFLPMYVGYAAAKALKISNPVWGMVIGALTIVPEFRDMVGATDTFKLFGFLSVPVADYGQGVVPVLLGVWVFKYIYNFLRKVIPDLLFSAFAPFIVFFVMIILMLGVFAPIGTVVGNLINTVFTTMANSIWPVKILAFILLTAAWPFITLCGMHLPISITMFMMIAQTGSDPFAMACMSASGSFLNGMALGAIFKFKNKDNRNMAISASISTCIGAICEPALYGIGLRNKSSIRTLVIGGVLAGIVAAILQPVCYNIVAGGGVFATLAPWSGGDVTNVIKGGVLSVVCYLIGILGVILFTKLEEKEEGVE